MKHGDKEPGFTIVQDLLAHQPIPEDGILTRQVYDDESLRVVLFTFSKNQRLSEHTASSPALLHFLSGEATLTLGKESFEVRAGAWVRMDPGLAHSVLTKSPVTMLLILLKRPRLQAP
jgi:quercetin dioxygenase-like cupin family protein